HKYKIIEVDRLTLIKCLVMKKRMIITAWFLLPIMVLSQKPDTLIKKLDSLNRKTDSAGGQSNNINRQAYNENTQFTFASYFILLGSDLKQEITAPFHCTGKDWGDVAKFAVVEGAFFFADEPVQRFALDLREHNAGVRNVSKYVTRFGGPYEMYLL